MRSGAEFRSSKWTAVWVLALAVGVVINLVGYTIFSGVGGLFFVGLALSDEPILSLWAVVCGAFLFAGVSGTMSAYATAVIAKHDEFLINTWQGAGSAISVLVASDFLEVLIPPAGLVYVLVMVPGLVAGSWLATKTNLRRRTIIHVPWT